MLRKKVIKEAKLRVAVHEFLQSKLRDAGYSGMRLVRTPIGTQISLFVHRPGLVIGTGGRNIRETSRILEERFQLSNPQVAIVEIEVPELDPRVMTSRIADALEKGVRYRRAANWALRRAMAAGAIGVQIMISGKLTSQRSRFAKFTEGYLPSSGDPAQKQVKSATVNVLLKQGLIGVKVKILPPGAAFPDDVKIKKAKLEEEKPTEESLEETKLEEQKTDQQLSEQEARASEGSVSTEEGE